MDGQYWKGDRTISTNEWLLASDFWQFLEPWHGRWYEYEILIASCTDNIYDLENERWLLGDMIDHVGVYGSRVAEGLSEFNVGLVSTNHLSLNARVMVSFTTDFSYEVSKCHTSASKNSKCIMPQLPCTAVHIITKSFLCWTTSSRLAGCR